MCRVSHILVSVDCITSLSAVYEAPLLCISYKMVQNNTNRTVCDDGNDLYIIELSSVAACDC